MAWYSGLVASRPGYAPWSQAQNEVARWYYEDLTWVYRHADQGGSFVGVRAKKLPSKKYDTARGNEPQRATPMHPEAQWTETHPPKKDERGVPIPERYGARGAEYMVINGRKMRWDGKKYVPMPVVRITTPRWRRSNIPVDTKLFHGPLLPKARTKAHSLTERIQSLQGPVISIDLSGATTTESVDLLDLLEALNA